MHHARHTFGRTSRRRSGLRVESLERRLLACAEHDASGPIGTFPSIPNVPEAALEAAAIGAAVDATHPLSSIPVLDSLPGAPAVLYLDFNGHFDAVWGTDRNVSTPVFDRDGDPASFSDSELNTIRQVWQQVAEDFAPFNINVTTVEPASFANRRAMRAAIGGDGAWSGGAYGGVAYVDSLTNSLTNSVYVFPKNLSNGNPRYVAEAVSHEAGHSFGLNHQSSFSATGAKLNEYNPGSFSEGRAPIMGSSYSATRGLWWKGQDSDNTLQDDLAVIGRSANGFGFRSDDHGDAADHATALSVSQAGDTVSGAGIVGTTADVDYFSFATGAGQITLTVDVPSAINNLDSRLELHDSAGSLVASAAPSAAFGAAINATVAAGTYYAVVGSQGNYGDIGQYTVSGTIVPLMLPSDSIPPAIAEVHVRNSAWSPEILAAMEAAGLGAGGVIIGPGDAAQILPWSTGIDQIIVRFDSEVSVSPADLVLSGLASLDNAVETVGYDPLTNTATWTLAHSVIAGQVSLDFAAVHDPAGNSVVSPSSYSLLLLSGDTDRSGVVDGQDFQANLAHQFSRLGDPGYDVLHDIDANGAVNIHDWQAIYKQIGPRSPQDDPAPAQGSPVAPLGVSRISRTRELASNQAHDLRSIRPSIASSRRIRVLDALFTASSQAALVTPATNRS